MMQGWMSLGLLSLLLGGSRYQPIETLNLNTAALTSDWASVWIAQLAVPDPVAEGIVQGYVTGLAASGLNPASQGVWVQVGPQVIAEHQGGAALSAASLTKMATTLTALERLGPAYQFETLVGIRGSLAEGVVTGDLIIQGSGDPFFVWEEAIAVGNALQQLGIRRVTGNLVIVGNFPMNFEMDPVKAGDYLIEALNSQWWQADVWQQYQTLPPQTPQPQVAVEGTVQLGSQDTLNQVNQWVLRHRSLPLVAMLKAMNIYSNNVMAELMAEAAGGPQTVASTAAALAGVDPQELRLINGSGLGEENQISPHALTAILTVLQTKLQQHDFNVADVMPVAGTDEGTLLYRRLPTHAALKTGSLAEVSSLAGVFPTRSRGLVWFTIINRGGDLEGLRSRQDTLLYQLQEHWGKADTLPANLTPKVYLGRAPYQLGDPKRVEAF